MKDSTDTAPASPARTEWNQFLARWHQDIDDDALAFTVMQVAARTLASTEQDLTAATAQNRRLTVIMTAADRHIRGLLTENAQLRAELDQHSNMQVLHCMDRDLELNAAACPHEPAGTILRATDTGRELIRSNGLWLPREST